MVNSPIIQSEDMKSCAMFIFFERKSRKLIYHQRSSSAVCIKVCIEVSLISSYKSLMLPV